jgi:hypothetical protein
MLEVLEHGDIQFFFRPSVQAAEAQEHARGVQSFFLILSPAGGGTHRRLRVGKNRMPAAPRERFWVRVERVGSMQRVLGDVVESETYSTKTRGERYQPGARPVARGTYAIVRHDDHVHFEYDVEPFAFEDAPEELHLQRRARHLVLFENHEGRATWTQHGDPGELDEGAEIVLAGSSPCDDELAAS